MFNESPKGFPKVWTWYSTFTSVEGLVQFFASKNVISKAYWLIILVAATVATSINVFNVFEDFLSYPVVTDVKVIQNSSIEFPSVTICNTNRVHCGNLLKYVSTCQNVSTGSPHFTRFHITRFTLYTRFMFLPNQFTLCNALHVFLTFHYQMLI